MHTHVNVWFCPNPISTPSYIYMYVAVFSDELGKQCAQGQAYANVAYAFSQIDNLNKAGDYYQHALQAAKDAGKYY